MSALKRPSHCLKADNATVVHVRVYHALHCDARIITGIFMKKHTMNIMVHHLREHRHASHGHGHRLFILATYLRQLLSGLVPHHTIKHYIFCVEHLIRCINNHYISHAITHLISHAITHRISHAITHRITIAKRLT
jgi:hypothetical protein